MRKSQQPFTHSFIVVTYNQAAFVKAALDSILNEDVLPDEMIIGDDASTDGTQGILDEYQKKFPEIIKLVLQEKNCGIFENLNTLTSLPQGDFVHFLAGDDIYAPGYIDNVNRFVLGNGIDPRSESFVLIPHVYIDLPDGRRKIHKCTESQVRQGTPLSLGLREKITYRYTGISRAAFVNWPLYPTDSEEIGVYADRLQWIHFLQYVARLIPAPFPGNIYRAGVGISARTNARTQQISYLNSLNAIKELAKHGSITLSPADSTFLNFEIAFRKAILDPGVRQYMELAVRSAELLFASPGDIPTMSMMFAKQLIRTPFYYMLRNVVSNATRALRS